MRGRVKYVPKSLIELADQVSKEEGVRGGAALDRIAKLAEREWLEIRGRRRK